MAVDKESVINISNNGGDQWGNINLLISIVYQSRTLKMAVDKESVINISNNGK